MMPKKQFVRISLRVLIAGLIAGCTSSNPASIQRQGISTDQVQVPAPNVQIDHGVMTVTGNVQRKPGVTAPISGRVDITVTDNDGNSLLFLPALLTPDPIPTEGRGESQYTTHYGWVPPAGSIVRAHFVDAETAQREDVNGIEYEGTSGLKSTAGAPAGHSGFGQHHSVK